MQIDWKIVSRSDPTNSMVVQYSGDFNQLLNIPIPPADKVLEDWVRSYVPAHVGVEVMMNPDAVIGATGSFEVAPAPSVPQTEQSNVIGSWQEEYIRALIYTVMEEIREQTV